MKLEPGEKVILRRFANRIEGETAAGGQLVLTTNRLIYRPHLIVRFGGFTGLEVSRSDIVAVQVGPPRDRSEDRRRTLKVSLHDGSTEFFVVNRVAKLAETLRHELSAN